MGAPSSASRVLEAQAFSGNPLVRGLGRGVTFQQVLQSPDLRLLPISERKVGTNSRGLGWLTRQDLSGLGWRLDVEAGAAVVSGKDETLPIYVLGRLDDRWHAALDVSVAIGAEAPPEGLPRLSDLRGASARLRAADLATAGQAVALAQWHASHLFCPRCGAATRSAEGGARRQCSASAEHRLYPRTDPVVIMLVESPDGVSALLGRPRNYRMANMLTCLSGFVDQGESVEEAVAREIQEEAGLKLTKIEVLGSQPWPIGRGGSCELMLGCIAKAEVSSLDVDQSEMDVVQWVSRQDVLTALQKATTVDLVRQPEVTEEAPFYVPPPFAIAHHLLKTWATKDGPWFEDSLLAKASL